MKQTDLFWFWNNNQRQESLSLCYMYVLFNIFFKGHNQIRFENTNWRSSSIKFLKHSVSSFPHQELNCTCSRFLRHSWDGDGEKITQENEEVCIKHPHIGALWTHSHLPGDPVAADTQILWSQQLSVVNFMSSLSLVGISLTHCVNSWTGMILQILHLYLTDGKMWKINILDDETRVGKENPHAVMTWTFQIGISYFILIYHNFILLLRVCY